MTPAFILRRNPYRDASLLLDLFTLEQGRISAVARYSKKQSHRLRGMLEPFRLLEIGWLGKGEVFTLTQAEEKRRYPLKQAALVQATYVNKVLLRAFQPMQPTPELFDGYRQLLARLLAGADMQAVMRFELEALAANGHTLNLWTDDASGQDIDPQMRYRFRLEQGLFPLDDAPEPDDTVISGQLLRALRAPDELPPALAQELRRVLDRLLRFLLQGKTLYARSLLTD